VGVDCVRKQAIKIPVIGNGDIRSPEDACAMIAQTGCDAVMIGRMAPANPWIFRQIEQYVESGGYAQPTEAEPLPDDPHLFPDAARRRNARLRRQDETVCIMVYTWSAGRRGVAQGHL